MGTVETMDWRVDEMRDGAGVADRIGTVALGGDGRITFSVLRGIETGVATLVLGEVIEGSGDDGAARDALESTTGEMGGRG